MLRTWPASARAVVAWARVKLLAQKEDGLRKVGVVQEEKSPKVVSRNWIEKRHTAQRGTAGPAKHAHAWERREYGADQQPLRLALQSFRMRHRVPLGSL